MMSRPNIQTRLMHILTSTLFVMLVECGLENNPDEERVENNSNNNDITCKR
jgi:hypothetical protein